MPDWAPEIIHNASRLVAVLSLYPACYTVFAWVEDRLSASVKQEITAWLKSAGDFAKQHTLSFNLLRFHSELFGDKQLSIKCIVRTFLFSLSSFLIVLFPYIIAIIIYIPNVMFGTDKFKIYADTLLIEFFIISFIFLVLPLDWLGVYVTRKLASRAGNSVTFKKVALIFLFDTFSKAIIFPIISFIFLILFIVILSMIYYTVDMKFTWILVF